MYFSKIKVFNFLPELSSVLDYNYIRCVSLLLWIYLIFWRVLGLGKNDCRARVTFLCTVDHLAPVFPRLLTGFCLTWDPVLCFLSPYTPGFLGFLCLFWLSWYFWETFLCLIFFELRLWVFGTVSCSYFILSHLGCEVLVGVLRWC